jgi:GTP pyrophosphokinase
MEVQIRTRAMHEHAEHGVAAHWAYKEAGAKGYAGLSQASDEGVAEARKAVLRQLLAWERDLFQAAPAPAEPDEELSRIFVFTPQAAVVELCAGATPIDFAYTLHTELGHRIRGAKVDGHLVPLNTALQSGQTVEVMGGKERGPSLDWLNPEAGYLASPRSRAKVRAWFNALQQQETVARGREAVEKLLAREGKSAIKHEELAARLGLKGAEQLFELVGKDELSLKTVEQLLRPAAAATESEDEAAARHHVRPARESNRPASGGVLVVGVDSLLTNLARCCRPAPPDPIRGYVTRGRGVAIHPRRLRQPARHAGARARTRHRGHLGKRDQPALSGRPEHRGPGPPRRAARRTGGVRQTAHPRQPGAHAKQRPRGTARHPADAPDRRAAVQRGPA